MSGYSEEDDEADRAYWSRVAHGGAGDEHEDDQAENEPTAPTQSPKPRRVPPRGQPAPP